MKTLEPKERNRERTHSQKKDVRKNHEHQLGKEKSVGRGGKGLEKNNESE